MSEKGTEYSQESQAYNKEAETRAEQSRKNIERIKQLAEQEKDITEQAVERLRERVEAVSTSREEVRTERMEAKPRLTMDHSELKRRSFDKTMEKIQSQLPPVERAFSKVIHQKSVEKISNASGRTIARPSGILGGGVSTFLGSAVVLYLAKYYGFSYNYTIFIMLFGIGFVAGLLIEVLFKIVKNSKRS